MSTKRKSTQWSKNEIKDIVRTVKEHGTVEGYKIAAAKYGVTTNAISCKYSRTIKGESMKRPKNNTTKVPFVKQVRLSKTNPKDMLGIPVFKPKAKNEIAFDIKDFRIDLKTKKLIITF